MSRRSQLLGDSSDSDTIVDQDDTASELNEKTRLGTSSQNIDIKTSVPASQGLSAGISSISLHDASESPSSGEVRRRRLPWHLPQVRDAEASQGGALMSTNKKSKPATRATPLTRKKPKTKAALNQGTSQALPLSDREPSTKRRKLAEDPSAERFYSSQHILNQWTIPVSQQSYRSSQPICENLESGSESELWIDKHAPLSEHELAVHTRKVKEVRAWLTQALSNSERSHARSLVGSIAALTGPSGAGKTAVIRALAKEMGFEIMEWSNPYNVNVLSEMSDSGNRRNATDEFQPRAGMVSITVQFQDFLASASKAPSLTFTNMPDAIDDYIPLPSSSPSSDRKVILVEDLPNVSNATTRTGVHTAIRNYIRSPRTKYPIVFIISDSTISTFDDEFLSGRSDASIDVNLVIPPDVRSSRAFTEIKFNPVAPTYLLKLLTRISNLEFRSPRQYKYRYDKESLDAIGRASGGDIRCALNSLQFHCLQPVENAPTRRKGKTGRPISEALITNVGARKVNLTIFHSIGRVLQTKRKAPLRTGQIIESLPEHLRPSYRHPVVHDPEEIFETSNLGAASYQTFLHENCALYYTDIDEMVTASSYLSSADLLLGRWQYQSSLASYAASITTRGLQFAHVHPVPAQPFGSRHLYKPAMFSALRKCRDTSSMISNIESEWLQAAILKKDRHVMQTEVRYSPPVLATDLLPYLGIIQDCSARIRQQRYMPVQVPPWQKQRPSLSRIPNKSEIQLLPHYKRFLEQMCGFSMEHHQRSGRTLGESERDVAEAESHSQDSLGSTNRMSSGKNASQSELGSLDLDEDIVDDW